MLRKRNVRQNLKSYASANGKKFHVLVVHWVLRMHLGHMRRVLFFYHILKLGMLHNICVLNEGAMKNATKKSLNGNGGRFTPPIHQVLQGSGRNEFPKNLVEM
jgi:hypothetical protein